MGRYRLVDYTRELIGVLMLSLVPMLALLAVLAVRRERVRQLRELPKAPLQPNDCEFDFKTSGLFYVATTFQSNPLRRVWAHGLGSRGRAAFVFGDSALEVHREGERDFAIFYRDLEVSTDRATIDRGTEPGGLLQLKWELSEARVISSFRMVSAHQQELFLRELREQINEHSK